MFMKKIWLPLLSALLVSACSTTPTPSQKYAKFTAKQIYQTAEIKLAKRDYRESIEAYEALDALYPFNKDDQQAELDVIYAYFQNDDMPAAAASAERYIRLYPRAANVDYAYYMKGVANFYQDRGWFQRYMPTDQAVRDPGSTLQSYKDFEVLLKLYPDSQYAPDARQRLVYLRNLSGRYQEEVAAFYLEKQAYVAAINRAKAVISLYNETPSCQKALVIMIKAYQALGLTAQAVDASAVLQQNYPMVAFALTNGTYSAPLVDLS